MNNITKNLLLGLTLVCIIAIIVFCIQLIVINRGVTPVEPGTTISGGTQQPAGETGSDSDEGDEDASQGEDRDDGSDDEEAPPLQNTPRPPPSGARRSFPVTSNSRLIVYSNDDLFDFVQGDLDWWFLYIGEGEATLEIAFEMVTTQGIAAHAETFLINYSGSESSQFNGEEIIQGSALRGYHVSANVARGTYEAWLHNLEGSDLALVFVIFYENEMQKNALYEILSSLDIETT